MNSKHLLFAVALAAGLLLPSVAFAASAGMPWEGPLEQVSRSLTGPVAKVAGLIIIAFFGISMAMSEGGSWMKRAAQIGFGLSIAFTGASWGLPLLGYSGGALV
ncbi:TrbC/VirB2 family protein [Myxococcus sp. MISCRS1]|uniref:TrbC/VirB2 family protein n=1 Tax=Myxococcus sp. MISCRS1 TaxID=2996786 RepID=UPI00226E4477|nr:TrbC/VirB2 family protein [Myxococcus sp. MISCRS1]MCY1003902.1 TrbC/VirB2 family protein [Myxococcus sp. MISCRS1]